MKIKYITFTGADDTIEPALIVHPNVEWGILFSSSKQKSNRFPSFEWIEDLIIKQPGINLSAHICGRWVREICKGQMNEDIAWVMSSPFGRIQLNFHAYIHFITNLEDFTVLMNSYGGQWIFQFDDINNSLLDQARNLGVTNALALFDTSGGAGIVPDEWPKTESLAGYAGGLGPDNLADELKKIEDVVGDGTIWVDMETKG